MAGLPLAVRAGLGVVLGLSLVAGLQQPSVAARFDRVRAAPGDEVAVHVTVALEDDVPLDSTRSRGPPIVFTVGRAEEQLLGVSQATEGNGGGQQAGASSSSGLIAASPQVHWVSYGHKPGGKAQHASGQLCAQVCTLVNPILQQCSA
jgi:hypothetical protein